jgi:acetyl-CoA carboxylase carboxyl transferase subunit alpha
MKKNKDKFDEIDAALKELQETISRLDGVDATDLARKVDLFREEIYSGISRWSSLELARHSDRPVFDDFLNRIFTGFTELHGDRLSEDDPAVRGGFAFLDDVPVVVMGHRKHSSSQKDYVKCHYGMASPSGHHKAARLMKLAEKFRRPLVTFVDTPGAYPVPENEYKGQAFSIARCISALAGVRTPVIAVIIGEAGSGGALALGFGDRVVMLENAFYSAISPEGYSSIIYGDDSNKEVAADKLKGTGRDLFQGGIVDFLVREPIGGAHNDPVAVIDETGRVIRQYLTELMAADLEELMRKRAVLIDSLIPAR